MKVGPENGDEQPGQKLVSRLRRLYLYRPSLVGHTGGIRYWIPWTVILITMSFQVVRYLLGAFSTHLGLLLGNCLNVVGFTGQMMSFMGGMFAFLIIYFRFRLFQLEEIPFIHELVAYDSLQQQAILSGNFRSKMATFLSTAVKILNLASTIMASNMMLSIFAVGIVTPVIVQGFTLRNVLYWTAVNIPFFYASYYASLDWVYILGSWFLYKSHLDIQADVIIDKVRESTDLDVVDVANLDFQYKKLLTRVKKFDNLSKDIISPYRLLVSYLGVVVLFATRHSGILILEIAVNTIVTAMTVISFVFLYSTCSLSIRRRKMYQEANSLYARVSRQRSTSICSLVIIRRLLKSMGDEDYPSLCLTDKSGVEFDPMEYVQFILELFSNFTLIAGLYNDYVK